MDLFKLEKNSDLLWEQVVSSYEQLRTKTVESSLKEDVKKEFRTAYNLGLKVICAAGHGFSFEEFDLSPSPKWNDLVKSRIMNSRVWGGFEPDLQSELSTSVSFNVYGQDVFRGSFLQPDPFISFRYKVPRSLTTSIRYAVYEPVHPTVDTSLEPFNPEENEQFLLPSCAKLLKRKGEWKHRSEQDSESASSSSAHSSSDSDTDSETETSPTERRTRSGLSPSHPRYDETLKVRQKGSRAKSSSLSLSSDGDKSDGGRGDGVAPLNSSCHQWVEHPDFPHKFFKEDNSPSFKCNHKQELNSKNHAHSSIDVLMDIKEPRKLFTDYSEDEKSHMESVIELVAYSYLYTKSEKSKKQAQARCDEDADLSADDYTLDQFFENRTDYFNAVGHNYLRATKIATCYVREQEPLPSGPSGSNRFVIRRKFMPFRIFKYYVNQIVKLSPRPEKAGSKYKCFYGCKRKKNSNHFAKEQLAAHYTIEVPCYHVCVACGHTFYTPKDIGLHWTKNHIIGKRRFKDLSAARKEAFKRKVMERLKVMSEVPLHVVTDRLTLSISELNKKHVVLNSRYPCPSPSLLSQYNSQNWK